LNYELEIMNYELETGIMLSAEKQFIIHNF